MKSWKSQKIPMHFFQTKDGAKHCKRYLGLNPPFDLIVHTGTAGTGSDILNTNHMFPNPVGPFTYPHTSLCLRSQNYFNRGMVFWGAYKSVFLCALVHGFRLPRTIQKTISLYCGKWTHIERKGHSIILMNFPMDCVLNIIEQGFCIKSRTI